MKTSCQNATCHNATFLQVGPVLWWVTPKNSVFLSNSHTFWSDSQKSPTCDGDAAQNGKHWRHLFSNLTFFSSGILSNQEEKKTNRKHCQLVHLVISNSSQNNTRMIVCININLHFALTHKEERSITWSCYREATSLRTTPLNWINTEAILQQSTQYLTSCLYAVTKIHFMNEIHLSFIKVKEIKCCYLYNYTAIEKMWHHRRKHTTCEVCVTNGMQPLFMSMCDIQFRKLFIIVIGHIRQNSLFHLFQ